MRKIAYDSGIEHPSSNSESMRPYHSSLYCVQMIIELLELFTRDSTISTGCMFPVCKLGFAIVFNWQKGEKKFTVS